MELIEYPDRDVMMIDVAQRLAGELTGALATHDRVSLAVPGGTTPGPAFDALAAARIDWDRVTVLPTDERCVPADADRSNARLIRERLLTGHAAAAQLVTMESDSLPDSDRLAAITAAVAPHLPLDICLLGMGADGHVASLFPGAPGLAAALADDAPPVMAIEAPGQPEPRLTLTAPVLTGALSLHLLIAGRDKRAALDAARDSGDATVAPVCAVLDDATVHYAE